MRQILNKIGSEERHTFKADFGKYGYKRYHDSTRGELYSPTMVVRNVQIIDDPEQPKDVTDHLWLNLTKGFASLGLLKAGDMIQFNGRVSQYNKGYLTKDKIDYELTYPTKIKLLTDRETQALPQDHQVLIGMIMNLNYKFYFNQRRPLVPYFMDAFADWQKGQDQPLPIECHKGNDFESQNNYDPYDYQEEEKALQKAQKVQKELKKKKQAKGVEFLKEHADLVYGLVKLGKKLQKENSTASDEYCYISNSKLTKLLKENNLEDKEKQKNIKQALSSKWFHEKFTGVSQELSPLEQLANKFNTK